MSRALGHRWRFTVPSTPQAQRFWLNLPAKVENNGAKKKRGKDKGERIVFEARVLIRKNTPSVKYFHSCSVNRYENVFGFSPSTVKTLSMETWNQNTISFAVVAQIPLSVIVCSFFPPPFFGGSSSLIFFSSRGGNLRFFSSSVSAVTALYHVYVLVRPWVARLCRRLLFKHQMKYKPQWYQMFVFPCSVLACVKQIHCSLALSATSFLLLSASSTGVVYVCSVVQSDLAAMERALSLGLWNRNRWQVDD